MTPLLHPFLVNDRFGDPSVYVEFLFEKRALLFDLGDLHALAPKKIHRLNDIFVSHTHIDHFIGFDQVLRLLIGRNKRMRLFGPRGFIDRIEHKLRSYTWNLAGHYKTDLVFEVTEIAALSKATTAEFRLSDGFRRDEKGQNPRQGDVVLATETFVVHASELDHRVPCLAYAVQEHAHVNIWKNRLDDLGLPTGPWLRELKKAVLRGDPDNRPIRAWWRERGEERQALYPLGKLKRDVLEIVPGQKIAYVVDALYSETNRKKILQLSRNADILFIEAAFAREEAARAADRYHLTTEQAGTLAREAGVRRVEPFHFSPRHLGQQAKLRQEVDQAFRGMAG